MWNSGNIAFIFPIPLDEDSDDDGYSDGDEHEAGSNPLDANDQPVQSGLNIILIKAAIDAKNP